MQIVDLAFSNGKKHDFKLFKESCFRVKPNSTIIADSAYQGLHKIYSNSLLPKKRSFSSFSDLKIKCLENFTFEVAVKSIISKSFISRIS